MTKIVGWMLIASLYIVVILSIGLLWGKLIYKHKQRFKQEIRDDLYREWEYEAAAADFQEIKADLNQHLKDDGFIEPEPGSEEHYQRWKAERKSREG